MRIKELQNIQRLPTIQFYLNLIDPVPGFCFKYSVVIVFNLNNYHVVNITYRSRRERAARDASARWNAFRVIEKAYQLIAIIGGRRNSGKYAEQSNTSSDQRAAEPEPSVCLYIMYRLEFERVETETEKGCLVRCIECTWDPPGLARAAGRSAGRGLDPGRCTVRSCSAAAA